MTNPCSCFFEVPTRKIGISLGWTFSMAWVRQVEEFPRAR